MSLLDVRKAPQRDRHRVPTSYTASVLERTQARALPVLKRAVDITPAVQTCCGACSGAGLYLLTRSSMLTRPRFASSTLSWKHGWASAPP